MRTINYRRWFAAASGVVVLTAIVASCGGTGGGGGSKGNPQQQFLLNSSNSGRLTLNVNPIEVDANKSDRIGLTATLTDSRGNPIRGIPIVFFTDLEDISFIPGRTAPGLGQVGDAITDANGNADIIAVAGTTPTSTGDIIGTGAIFASPPEGFSLLAQAAITLLDVGFIDADQLGVIPTEVTLVEPQPGQVAFFNLVGGTPPYLLKNESSTLGTATLSQHCGPGCTEGSGNPPSGLCIGSPCQDDGDCNENGSSTPADVCIGPIKRCLASCRGTNCGGSRCDSDADCNDGSATPANVCKDSGQSVAYIIGSSVGAGATGENNEEVHTFTVEDSAAGQVTVTVRASFICGNGTARGGEQCDLGDVNDNVCASFGLPAGCGFSDVSAAFCASIGITNPTSTTVECQDCQLVQSCEGTGGPPGGGTPTPGPGATSTAGGPTPTVTPGAGTPTPFGTPGPGVPTNLTLALLATEAGDNGNNTLTTVVAATVTDSLGNPVPNGTSVLFSIVGATAGAAVSSPSSTNSDPPCNVSNFTSQTGVSVVNQPGVAHTCVTYPVASVGQAITISSVSGAASDSDSFVLPNTPP